MKHIEPYIDRYIRVISNNIYEAIKKTVFISFSNIVKKKFSTYYVSLFYCMS